VDYASLGLADIHLGYAGRFAAGHPIHQALARLQPGDPLHLRSTDRNGLGLYDSGDRCVARLSRRGSEAWESRHHAVRDVRVLALVHRRADQDEDHTYTHRYRVSAWEIPVVEIVVETEGEHNATPV
jgi:ATP-dependent DNA helicase RecQ